MVDCNTKSQKTAPIKHHLLQEVNGTSLDKTPTYQRGYFYSERDCLEYLWGYFFTFRIFSMMINSIKDT